MKTKLNVKLLRKVQKFILAEADRFDMGHWLGPASESYGLLKPACGTVCCIAGAVYAIENKLDLKKGYETLPSAYETRKFACQALGFDVPDENSCLYPDNSLFLQTYWPKRYQTAYTTAVTQSGRARAAVRRIEHFIKTKGAE